MTITLPRVYHYLFTHIPGYTSVEDARQEAQSCVARLALDLKLRDDTIQELSKPHPDVEPLSFRADDKNGTYLLQFLFHDVIATILDFEQLEEGDPYDFLRRKHTPHFPSPSNKIGESTVLFAQGETDLRTLQELVATCFEMEVTYTLPCCQFSWGTLYFFAPANSYLLLVPDPDKMGKGDQFLSFSFPILEAIRQKMLYEEQVSHHFKEQNIQYEKGIGELLDAINQELEQESKKDSSTERSLRQIDEYQAQLYQNIAYTDALLLTLDININNFERFREVLPIKDDTFFAPCIPEFQFIQQQIEYNLKYIKFLLPGLEKREELLRLKIEWKQKDAEERSNLIRERTNAIMFSFGVALGIGQMLMEQPQISLTLKASVMLGGGIAAYLLNHFFGTETVNAILDTFGGAKEKFER